MTVQSKIYTSNAILAILVTALLAFKTDTFPGNGFFFMVGAITIAGGIGCLLLGILLWVKKNRTAAKAYFISGLILLLAGLASYLLLNKY